MHLRKLRPERGGLFPRSPLTWRGPGSACPRAGRPMLERPPGLSSVHPETTGWKERRRRRRSVGTGRGNEPGGHSGGGQSASWTALAAQTAGPRLGTGRLVRWALVFLSVKWAHQQLHGCARFLGWGVRRQARAGGYRPPPVCILPVSLLPPPPPPQPSAACMLPAPLGRLLGPTIWNWKMSCFRGSHQFFPFNFELRSGEVDGQSRGQGSQAGFGRDSELKA